MKLTHILIYCLFLAVAFSQVVNITLEQTFNQIINKNKYVMVKFYAPWCGHCKTMIPEYEKLADLLKDNDVVIAEVDATVQTSISEKYDVRGFPTIKFFVDAAQLDYKGARTAQDMYEWIKKVTEAHLKTITQQQVNQLKTKQSFVVYYGTNQITLKTLQLLTISDPTTSYFHSSQQSEDNLVLYPKGQSPIYYNQQQPLTTQNIKQWILVNTLETVIPLSTKEHLEYVIYDKKTLKDVALLFRENDLSQETFERFENICQINKDQLKCCFVDSTMEIYTGVKSYVRSRGKTVLTLTKDTLKQAYTYPLPLSEITQQSWTQFVQQVSQNKHQNIASAENDQLNYQYVKTLLTENYTSFINENDAVFVEYVSPGCAKCAEFAEEFDLLAKEIYENKDIKVEVAVIDMRKNMEVAAQLQIMDFPTFRLHLAGAHIQYKGVNDRKEMLKFIEKNMNIKPIQVGFIAQVPTPSVIIYDPAQSSSLNHLPAIFTRYPVYHLQQGGSIKIVVRHNEQQKTFPSDSLTVNVSSVSSWLYKQTDPIMVNMLMTSVQGKLRDALKNQVHLLGLIDIETQLSASLTKTMEEYCRKNRQLVCGYAKKGEDHFDELMAWAGLDKDITSSQVIYINTVSFDKFIFTENIQELSVEKIEQFVADIKEGKVIKHARDQAQDNKENEQSQQRPEDLPSSQEL